MASIRIPPGAFRRAAEHHLLFTRSSTIARPFYRTYANDTGSTTSGTPGAATNIYDSPSTNPESTRVNVNRSTESTKTPDNAAASRQPVSPTKNPQHASQQDDPVSGSDNMKRPPEEPDEVKRFHVEREGQKPLDPADTGVGKSTGTGSQ